MKTANFVMKCVGKGEKALFHLEPPLEGHALVVVSAVIAPFSGPETYIFPSTEDGEVIDWGELDGSFRGEENIKKALENAGYAVMGYEVVKDE